MGKEEGGDYDRLSTKGQKRIEDQPEKRRRRRLWQV
jgi:hypothetical protein